MIKILLSREFSLNLWKNKKQQSVAKEVSQILARVQAQKDQAIFELTKEQTAIEIASLQVPPSIMERALDALGSNQVQALEVACRNITDYHQKTKPSSWLEEDATKVWGQKFTSIKKVGIYIPCGLTAYPSSVLMNVIPAQLAGDNFIQVTSPPTKNGYPHNYILAVLQFLGIKQVFSAGGAQAIAALAYGTETIDKVHLITGPGNQFVAEAKKQLFGQVGIDAIAGPSEVAILLDSDEQTPCEWIAQDLIAQAEHGEDSKVILITSAAEKGKKIAAIVKSLVAKSIKNKILTKAIANYALVVITQNMQEAIELVNNLAPEHLQILANNKEILPKIRNAGAIFFGSYSPVAMGDYVAGPNHTLPTASSAKFSSSLSVSSFMKSSSYLEYKEKGFKENAIFAITLSDMEGNIEHGNSLKCRLD